MLPVTYPAVLPRCKYDASLPAAGLLIFVIKKSSIVVKWKKQIYCKQAVRQAARE